jgi:hypothetical protein
MRSPFTISRAFLVTFGPQHHLSIVTASRAYNDAPARVLCAILVLLAAMPANGKNFIVRHLSADYPTVQAVVQMDKLIRERSARGTASPCRARRPRPETDMSLTCATARSTWRGSISPPST